MEQIDPRRLLIRISEILERLNLPYLITGGIAVLVWGRPRFTADTDIVIDFWILKNNLFDKSRLKRRLAKEVLGKKVYFTSPEDLILIKSLWYKNSSSSRQLEDVESIFKIFGKELNKGYLKKWAEQLNVSDILGQFLV